MAEALELAKKKKKTSTKKKKKRRWKSTSHSVWTQVFQTQTCVTPPLTSNVLSAHWAHCIDDEPEVVIDSPAPICPKRVSITWPESGWAAMFSQQIICAASWSQPWRKEPDYKSVFLIDITLWAADIRRLPPFKMTWIPVVQANPLMFPHFPIKASNFSTCPHWGEQGQDVAALFWQTLPPSRLRTVTICFACAFLWFLFSVTDFFFTALGRRAVPANSLDIRTWSPKVLWILQPSVENPRVWPDWAQCQQSHSCNVRSRWANF